jgi:hypothetical protein
VLLADGTSTGYGFGVDVGRMRGHRLISHNGEVSGFTTQNSIFPDDRAAVVVVTNLDATGAPGEIAGAIATVLFTSSSPAQERAEAQAKTIFAGLQRGTIDRSLFTRNANAYFNAQALADFASSLAPLGAPTSVTETSESLRGGMTFRAFRVQGREKNVTITTFTTAGGTLEQFQIAPE